MTATGNSLRVMQVLWSVEAHANANLMCPKEIAPSLVDQRGIGLKDLLDSDTLVIQLLLQSKSPFVELDRDRQRLSGVPQVLERLAQKCRREQPLIDFGERTVRNDRARRTAGKITIAAVNVA